MRLALAVVFVLASCSPGHAKAPRWPKATEKEVDGGESLAPRTSASTVAAADDDDDEVETPATPATPEKPAATPDAAKPEPTKPATPAQASEEIIITTEEIVIEIDD